MRRAADGADNCSGAGGAASVVRLMTGTDGDAGEVDGDVGPVRLRSPSSSYC